MINLLILIPRTVKSQVVDNIFTKILPALKQAQGLCELKVSEGHIMSPGGPPPYSKVIEASFESLEVFLTWAKQISTSQSVKELMVKNGIISIYFEVSEIG
jgi:hypothetical protein